MARFHEVRVTVDGDDITFDFVQRKRTGKRTIAQAKGSRKDKAALVEIVEKARQEAVAK